MKYLFVINALSYNRGSEALIRGLTDIIRNNDQNAEIVVAAGNGKQKYPRIDGIVRIVPRLTKKRGMRKLDRVLKAVGIKTDLIYQLQCRKLIKESRSSERVLVIGADNYDFTYRMSKQMRSINNLLFSASHGKLFLIDSSFDERDLTEAVIQDISRFDYITVRESISLGNVQKKYSGNILRFPDPAFVMKARECELPDGFAQGKTVGVNLSGLVTGLSDKELLIQNYVNLIRHITENGDTVLLLPHVMGGADYDVLSVVYKACIDAGLNKNHIILWNNEEYDAEQIKYVISNLKALITARTHASIAAYSTCVPTLVLGYSVKSRGIATDLFGTDEHYVINYKDIHNDKDITSAYEYIEHNLDSIRSMLQKTMPGYKKDTFNMGRLFKDGEY